MYKFIDTNETSEGITLPSEALQINGEYIENQINGYRTLNVSGREALSPELSSFETGIRDGSSLKSKRYPARTIIVTYQLIANSNEEFREAFNKLASILDVEDAELIFNDEQDKFFIGTPSVIGEIEPGSNAVIGTFELFCADPFKYSVVEYVAEANLIDNGFLIDYNGTHKAYPTLEAEFFNENESDAALTGNGDCGYVAFFNEDEKIIQLGDPDEADSESFAKSQTLVTQNFNTETSWGTIAQTNWAANNANSCISGINQKGNVNIAAASLLVTNVPSTSGTLLTKENTAAKPNIKYTVTAKASGREEDRINVKVTVSAYVKGVTKTTTQSNGVVKGAAGMSFNIPSEGIPLYESSDSTSASATIRNRTCYLWDVSIKKGRIRITTQKSWVGKNGCVTGWVNFADTGFYTMTKNVTTTTGLEKGYGLKAGIQLGSGSWKYVTLKEEDATWNGNATYTKTLDVTVKDITYDTTEIEDIMFKVERTDDIDDKVGIIEETECANLEISTYVAPVADSWYLTPETFGTDTSCHGPSITRIIPADAAGDIGAKNFTFSYRQKMSIGTGSAATQEMGVFRVALVGGSDTSQTVIAGVDIDKSWWGKQADLKFVVNGKIVKTMKIDLSYNNTYFGAGRTSSITKSGKTITFNVGGINATFTNSAIEALPVKEVTFLMSQYGTNPAISYNGIYWAKFVKNNCDTWKDIPNKFSANDVVVADCKNGEIYLNGTLAPALGALGNDWEGFYLTPGLNQIGFSFSDWVETEYAPKFKIRYRESFI